MLRFFILLTLSATVYSADHELFKNCSRISFCNDLRNHTLDEDSQYAADTENVTLYNGLAYISLKNNKNQKLDLEIQILEWNTLRINVLEIDNARYKLTESLNGTPIAEYITNSKQLSDGVSLWNSNSAVRVTVTIGPPFSILCYYGDELQVVLKGDRLVMQTVNANLAYSFGVNFVGVDRLYGLYHHAYQLAIKKTADGSSDPFRLRNSDTSGYEVGSPMALYGSIPVIYGHSSSPNKTSGIFLNNAAEQWVDIDYESENDTSNGTAYFMVESGSLDLFVLLGPTPKDVVRQYTHLTGVAHLPQLWTLGYHQSRWSYMTQQEVKEVVAKMNANSFPLDAIWLDIDYTDGKKYFTWNPENFTDPVEMQQNISATHKKLVTILDPHLKVDRSYPVYVGSKSYYVKWDNGSDFQGDCWPGLSSYIDFLNPDGRDYYASWFAYDKFNGSTETLAGVWNDMNEPSVFDNSLEKTLPFETMHYNNVLHRDVHNIYGLMHTKATHQGLMQRDNSTKRPFILTRSHFAGSQRYAAVWTGDNTAGWEYLAVTYSECLTSNILGLVFCGADVGGFSGDPDDELLQRWYQAGAWLPFFRSHSDDVSKRREPYVFSEDVQGIIRRAVELRYKHIPVWYTLFYEHTRFGDPVIRPLFYHYPELLEKDNYLLLGSDILVRPVVQSNVTWITVDFPGNDTIWYRIDDESLSVHNGGTTENVTVGISDSPVYYRGGSIISRKDTVKLSTTETIDDPYTLYVNLDSDNNAEGRLYIDDYTSFDYISGSYLYLNITYIHATNGIRFRVIDGDGDSFTPMIRKIVIAKPTDGGGTQSSHTTTVDGTPLHSIGLFSEGKAQMSRRDVVLHL